MNKKTPAPLKSIKKNLFPLKSLQKSTKRCRFFFVFSLSAFFFLHSPLVAETIELTAAEFIKLVKENSSAIQIDRIDPLIQEAIVAENVKQKYNSPLTVFAKQNERFGSLGNDTTQFGAEWSYTFGPAATKVSVGTDFLGGRFSNVNPLTGQSVASLNWESAFSLGITQPLLYGGFVYFSNERELDIQRYATKISRATYNTNLAKNIQAALGVYYQYLVNQEMLTLIQQTLRESKQILSFNEKKWARSTLDRKDLLANRAQVLQAEIDLADTQKSISALKDRLLNYLGYKNAQADEHKLVLIDDVSSQKTTFSFQESYRKALANRSEIVTLQYQLAATENAIKLGQAALFPRLDLSLKLQFLGQGEKVGDSYSNMFQDIDKNINFEWGLSLSTFTDALSYKVTTARSKLQKIQTQKRIAQLKEEISIAVNQSLKNLETTYRDLSKRSQVLALQQERFSIAKRDYFNGKIDFSQNKLVQIDLTNAQIAYLSVKLKYLNDIVNHNTIAGTLTSDFSVDKLEIESSIDLENTTDYVQQQNKTK